MFIIDTVNSTPVSISCVVVLRGREINSNAMGTEKDKTETDINRHHIVKEEKIAQNRYSQSSREMCETETA